MFKPVRSLLALALVAVMLVSCGDDPEAPDTPGTINVYFNLNVGGPGLQLNNMIYTTPAGTLYSVKVLRFAISNLVLHTDDGRDLPLKDLHFYDVSDGATQSFSASVPHANFVGVSVTFGLDPAHNTRNRYQSNAKFHSLMQWPTSLGAELGYHYMQLEGNYELTPGGATTGYATHTGPRQLDGTNPDFPGVVDATAHHFDFTMDLPFTPVHVHEGGGGELQLYFDLAGWYIDHLPLDGDDTAYDFKDYPGQSIMGDLEAQNKLKSNGSFCFSATMTASGGHDGH